MTWDRRGKSHHCSHDPLALCLPRRPYMGARRMDPFLEGVLGLESQSRLVSVGIQPREQLGFLQAWSDHPIAGLL